MVVLNSPLDNSEPCQLHLLRYIAIAIAIAEWRQRDKL